MLPDSQESGSTQAFSVCSFLCTHLSGIEKAGCHFFHLLMKVDVCYMFSHFLEHLTNLTFIFADIGDYVVDTCIRVTDKLEVHVGLPRFHHSRVVCIVFDLCRCSLIGERIPLTVDMQGIHILLPSDSSLGQYFLCCPAADVLFFTQDLFHLQ